MNYAGSPINNLDIQPVTSHHWDDLTMLFGDKGACAGCWCMFWRLRRKEYDSLRGAGTRAALKSLVDAQEVPGLLANVDGHPAGWLSLGPREKFPVLENSRVLKRVDAQPVWSIVCFYIGGPYRHKGMSVALIEAGIRYAAEKGASIVEGYPIDPKSDKYPDTYAYTGLVSAFRKTGFVEVARYSPTRPIMRFGINTAASVV